MSSASASTTTDPGHAVRSDGTLKDASEIAWTYDADEDIPFPSGSTSGQEPRPSGRSAPAVVVAGTHRTTHVHCPLKRALEATEASTSADPGIKHKASTDPNPNRCVSRKIVINMDNNNNNNNNNDDDVDGDNAATDFNVSDFNGTEPADDYEIFEAMADADNQVSIIFSLELCSHWLLRLSRSGPVSSVLLTYTSSSVMMRTMYTHIRECL
jgi:hypothetical protein